MRKEALLYDKLAGNQVRCNLCSHHCQIAEGRLGICQVRENSGGVLHTLVYGQTISRYIDPIEKKPLYHFYPGSTVYSIATPGCNFRCHWCQNWQISQTLRMDRSIVGDEISPEQLVDRAKQAGCQSIAYTYTEPTIFFEYAYDTARLARSAGLSNVYVTNGYMTSEMLEAIAPYLDAANVDLKAFRDRTYRQYMGARLQPVLDSLKKLKQLGIWLEVTTLVVPGINDESCELQDIATFILRELGADTPWHLSRFFPDYQLPGVPITPLETLNRARRLGQAVGLHYIYIGNAPEAEGQDTRCPQCDRALIRRSGLTALNNLIQQGRCPSCGYAISGIGLDSFEC
ncbi:MAG: AmmeMemoRadiSam system radical SAM enzyme [Cyanobacteria bacterium SID2]|nr:AmmeMemoRadiSam system radical SAM enzyme [Cyanobacteria bacterium SID2]